MGLRSRRRFPDFAQALLFIALAKYGTGFRDIPGYLLSQSLQRRKFLFISQFFQWEQFQLATVNITVELEQMRFHSQLRRRLFQRWPISNIQHGAISFAL